MKTIILPGFSPKNAEWARQAKGKLTVHGLQTTVHKWDHWEGGSFNPSYEVKKIIKEIGNQKVNILAKSVGTAIANQVIGVIPKQINKIILCGIPSVEIEKYANFSNFPGDKVIDFQNENDPWVKYEDVKKMLKAINPKITVIKKDRSDHHYPYYQDFSDNFKVRP